MFSSNRQGETRSSWRKNFFGAIPPRSRFSTAARNSDDDSFASIKREEFVVNGNELGLFSPSNDTLWRTGVRCIISWTIVQSDIWTRYTGVGFLKLCFLAQWTVKLLATILITPVIKRSYPWYFIPVKSRPAPPLLCTYCTWRIHRVTRLPRLLIDRKKTFELFIARRGTAVAKASI